MSLLLLFPPPAPFVSGTSSVTQTAATSSATGEVWRVGWGDDYETIATSSATGEVWRVGVSDVTQSAQTSTASGTVTSGGPPPPTIHTRPPAIHTGWKLRPNAIFRAMGRR